MNFVKLRTFSKCLSVRNDAIAALLTTALLTPHDAKCRSDTIYAGNSLRNGLIVVSNHQ